MKSQACLFTVSMVFLLLITACGSGSSAGGNPSDGGGITVTAKGNSLAFEQTNISVSAGQAVSLTLDNSLSTLEHNWVLVRGGEAEARSIAADALTAGRANHYLPSDTTNIIAATQVLAPGEAETITFEAPEPGIYFYICTVPGHYPLMRGRLVVE
ncbi:MAG: auracyanin [Candidatus Viridilinea halotolerans]|uniref:Auracyanin n=1 Tax=Candidatus Viridilinea halotolerans TaxID=2491704 RepID=A0A426TT63_9CHLR|nr:MAG: auracyanin [Candidatus Viridilinea halotolerans]